MEKRHLEYLKKHHKFKAWCGCNSLKENLFIWNYFLTGNELPGWQIYSNQPVTIPGWPRFIQSTWRHSEGDIEIALHVDVYECASRVKAHEFMLQLLGQFDLPNVEREGKIAVGDVAFANPTDAIILFARANFVLLLSNAGRELVPVSDIARPFDIELYSKPNIAKKAEAVPGIQRFKTTRMDIRVGESVPLEIEASNLPILETFIPLKRKNSAQPEQAFYYKFFSSVGEVFLEEGRPVYRSESSGPQELTVFSIAADHDVTTQNCKFNVK